MNKLCHSKSNIGLTVELLKQEGRENYTVLGYLSIPMKDGDVLIRLLERFPYIIDKNHAEHVYAELKNEWNMTGEDIGGGP